MQWPGIPGMVNLGLVRDFESCPTETTRLAFSLSQGNQDQNLFKIKAGLNTSQWKLTIHRKAGEESGPWIVRSAKIIEDLGIHKWCVNTHDLAVSLGRPLDKALQVWGNNFWPNFRGNCLFFFETGNDVKFIRQVLLRWEKSHTLVCFRSYYDLTKVGAESAEAGYKEL